MALLQEKTWFKNIQPLVEENIKNCHTCQISTHKPACKPLQMSHYQQPYGKKSVLTLDTSKMESTFLLSQMNTHTMLLSTSRTPSQQHQSYSAWTRYSPNLTCQSPSKRTMAHHSTATISKPMPPSPDLDTRK